MTVERMQKLLNGLPKDMMVVMGTGEDIFVTVCESQSQVITLEEFDIETSIDVDPAMLPKKDVLLLMPCTCGEDLEKGEINSQPELN